MEESAKTSRHNARRSVRGIACGQPIPVSVRAVTPLLSRQPCPAIRLVRWYRDPRGRFAPHLRAVAAAACVRRFGAMCSDAHSLGARTRLCAASLDSRAGRNDSGMGGQGNERRVHDGSRRAPCAARLYPLRCKKWRQRSARPESRAAESRCRRVSTTTPK